MKADAVFIDGSSQFFRSFYALKGLATSTGFPTGAIYGFINIIRKIQSEFKPDYLSIAWDEGKPTIRTEVFKDYKSNRRSPPQLLNAQIPLLKKIIDGLCIPSFSLQGYEADDIIKTFCKLFLEQRPGSVIVIVTSDKDLMQMVDKNVYVYDPREQILYNEKAVEEKFGVPCKLIPDYLALKGDDIDNIPGIMGIGEETAKKLVSSFGKVEDIFENIDKLSLQHRNILLGKKEEALKSKNLATLKDVPISIKIEEFKVGNPNLNVLIPIYQNLEFTSFLKDFSPKAISYEGYTTVDSEEALRELVEGIKAKGEFSFDTETTSTEPTKASLVGISLCFDDNKAFYIPVGHKKSDRQLKAEMVLDILKPLLEDEKIKKYGQNIKYDMEVMKRYGIDVQGVSGDTMIASYLLSPDRGKFNLEEISLLYLGHLPISYEDVTFGGKINFSEVNIKDATIYSSEDSHIVWNLHKILEKQLIEKELIQLYKDVEIPLISVLRDMELAGVKVNVSVLREYSASLGKKIDELKKEIWRLCGKTFNLDSPRQVGQILFEHLKLPIVKKTKKKTSYSTDAEVLEELSESGYSVASLILKYRTLSKLKSGYVDSLPKLVSDDGRIHTSFHQTRTGTGRLSSSEPNLQNIPARGEEGAKIREAFCADNGKNLISADYSQIELRILAHFSQDAELIKAFKEDKDIHSHVATSLFGVDDITEEMRRKAKIVNFGIAYGITPHGLATQLRIPHSDAEKLISSYFHKYKQVRAWIDAMIKFAEENLYVRTLFSRIRYVPKILSEDKNERAEAERIAINTPIQGTAADIIKIAMINIWKRFKKELPTASAHIILQVHDELIVEAEEKDLEKVTNILKEEMENAASNLLKIPLKVKISTGKTWAEI